MQLQHPDLASYPNPSAHLMNQPSKKGRREDLGGGRGSNGDAPTTCGDMLTVPPPSKKTPTTDARWRPRLNSTGVGLGAVDIFLPASSAGGAAALPLCTSAFRLPLRRRAHRQGNDHAVLAAAAVPDPPAEFDFSAELAAAPPPSGSTFGTLLASGTPVLITPNSWLNTTSARTSARHISAPVHGHLCTPL